MAGEISIPIKPISQNEFINQWDEFNQQSVMTGVGQKGKLIVFEGIEGSGKTTQLEQTYQWLIENDWIAEQQSKGTIGQIIKTREPGGTELGKRIRELLLQQGSDGATPLLDRAELLLYAADRAQHVEACLRPWLAQGALVLCDRFTDSTLAYQGYGRGLDLALIHQLNAIATQGLQSDLTFWLDVDVDTGLNRIRHRGALDRVEQADLSFHDRVRRGYKTLAAQRSNFVRIDAGRDAAFASNQVQYALARLLIGWYGHPRE